MALQSGRGRSDGILLGPLVVEDLAGWLVRPFKGVRSEQVSLRLR